jgi:hypothetical protein
MKSWRWAKMLECSKSADLECRKRLSLSLDNRSFVRENEEIDSKVRTPFGSADDYHGPSVTRLRLAVKGVFDFGVAHQHQCSWLKVEVGDDLGERLLVSSDRL